jgi:hypothetical protein
MIEEIYRCPNIFTNLDYFELLLKAYHFYDLDDLDYFALRDLALTILQEFGCIPVRGVNKDTDVDHTIKLIKKFRQERNPFNHVNVMCFNYYDEKRKQIMECRIVERPILFGDGEVVLFRSKNLESDFLFFGLKFTKYESKLSAIHLIDPAFASGFFLWLCHAVKIKLVSSNIKSVEDAFTEQYQMFKERVYNEKI